MRNLTSISLQRFQRRLAWTVAAIFLTHGVCTADPPHVNKFVLSEDASGTLANYSVVGKIGGVPR